MRRPRVRFSKQFEKGLGRLSAKSQERFYKRLELFLIDRTHPLLRLHPLKGKYSGYYSINVTGDLRAIFKYRSDGSLVFLSIGSHSQLY